MSGAVMLLRCFPNALFVERLTKQHAVQQAKERSSDDAFSRSERILFQATRVPQHPARTSPIPPDRFSPPFSLHTIIGVSEVEDACRM
ncbi:unnamed protein product [Pseudo-nitzschia multistriata]|uniref:Uncharacterized protein n=1 Tax=Pseudo-nitzschia multistriata TaxID=183589 RepID=A0A448ZM28_9STRA|nr:unnamed protein product [Pseudo-nitzschia multistriata]